MLPAHLKTIAQGKLDSLPHSSPFKKLEILPKKIPIGAAAHIKSVRFKNFKLFFKLNKSIDSVMPISPPWKDMPPCQTYKILIGEFI